MSRKTSDRVTVWASKNSNRSETISNASVKETSKTKIRSAFKVENSKSSELKEFSVSVDEESLARLVG